MHGNVYQREGIALTVLLAHVSDIHLGRRQYGLEARAKDYEKAFMRVVDKLVELKKEKDLEAVLVTGDVFDSPRPTPSMYMAAIEGFAKLRDSGLKVFAIRGNHDASPLNPVDNPLKVLSNTGMLTLLDDGYKDLGDVRVVGIGCRPGDRGREVVEKVKGMSKGKQTVVMLHQYVRNTPYRYPMPDLDYFTIDDRELPDEPYYALGHIHEHGLRHPRLRAAYAGSLEIWDSSEFETYELVGAELRRKKEQDRKGFLLLEVGGDIKTYDVEIEGSRRMIRLIVGINGDEPGTVEKQVEEAIHGMKVRDSYVEVELVGTIHDGARLRDYALKELKTKLNDVLKIDVRLDLHKREIKAEKGPQRYGINEIIRNALLSGLTDSTRREDLVNAVMEALVLVEEGKTEEAIKLIRNRVGLNNGMGVFNDTGN